MQPMRLDKIVKLAFSIFFQISDLLNERKYKKINQYLKLIIKGVMIMYKLVFAQLVKMQIELASQLERLRCENFKENTKCLIIYQGVRTNKTVKILDMSLRQKKVCPVY